MNGMGIIRKIIKDWMLPLALACGIGSYLIYHFTPALAPAGPVFYVIAAKGQPIVIAIILFLQYVKISPHDLKFHTYHLWLLLFQSLTFVSIAMIAAHTPEGDIKILLESAMLCFICPTAAAAGVITEKLGGNLKSTVTYVLMINCMASILIPGIIPLVNNTMSDGFLTSVLTIGKKILPILILPFFAAWTIRYTCKKLQRWLMRRSEWAFYCWGICLTLAMVLATRAMVMSHISIGIFLCIALVSMGSCAIQFAIGRRLGSHYGIAETITAGQSLGQKNSGFLIWLGYSFLTPVTSVAGGLYSIWQNIFNSWELYEERHKASAGDLVKRKGKC